MPPPAPVPITATSKVLLMTSPFRRRQVCVRAIVDVRARGRGAVVFQGRVVDLAVTDLARIETHGGEIAHVAEEFLADLFALAMFRAPGEGLEQRRLLFVGQFEEHAA